MKPVKWWMRLLNRFSQCQTKTIEEQLELGVRMFDIRIRPYTHTISHGIVEYEGNVSEILSYLNRWVDEHDEAIFVRLCLENKSSDDRNAEIQWFKEQFKLYKEYYPYLHFCGGCAKHPWEKIVECEDPSYVEMYWTFLNFINPYLTLNQKIRRVLTNILHFNPKYWAIKDNKNYKVEYSDKDTYLMLDFVEL